MKYSKEKEALAIFDFIKKNDDFLVTAHYSPDGDNIGSSIAMYHVLISLGKKATIMNRDDFPKKYDFIKPPDYPFYKTSNFKEKIKFKNVIILDTADIHRVGNVIDYLDKNATVVNIDHHYTNTNYGQYNFINSNLASASEVLYDILKINNYKITKEIASALYTGLLSDTGGFRFKNTKPIDLQIASELSEYGIDVSYLMNKVFFSKSFQDVTKYAEIVSRIELIQNKKLAVLYHDEVMDPIPEHDPVMEAMDSIIESKVNVFVRKIGENKLRLSIRSKSDFNAADFVEKYGGGGHKMAAGMFFEGEFEEFEETVLKELKSQL
ncbi:MAG: DHH family phosphoesterase [Candidatus Delongbacteria bacterium]|nr:DHH family phosphoesterase [Candidatus Delongbacteria bacterium]